MLEVVGNAKMNSFVMKRDSRRVLHEEYVVLHNKIFQFCEAQYAIENEIMDYDKSEAVLKRAGVDIIGTIQLNKADQAPVQAN